MKLLLVLFIILFASSNVVYAEERARLRYADAIRLANANSTPVGEFSAESICFATRSRLSNVSVDDIRIYLKRKQGDIEIELDKDGKFTLPVNENLRSENPWITTNQPKGSMRLLVNWGERLGISPQFVDGEWRLPYESLFPMRGGKELLDVAADAVAKDPEPEGRAAFSLFANRVVLSHVEESAMVDIVVDNVRRAMPSGANKKFAIDFNEDLVARDVWIVVKPGKGWSAVLQANYRPHEDGQEKVSGEKLVK